MRRDFWGTIFCVGRSAGFGRMGYVVFSVNWSSFKFLFSEFIRISFWENHDKTVIFTVMGLFLAKIYRSCSVVNQKIITLSSPLNLHYSFIYTAMFYIFAKRRLQPRFNPLWFITASELKTNNSSTIYRGNSIRPPRPSPVRKNKLRAI